MYNKFHGKMGYKGCIPLSVWFDTSCNIRREIPFIKSRFKCKWVIHKKSEGLVSVALGLCFSLRQVWAGLPQVSILQPISSGMILQLISEQLKQG